MGNVCCRREIYEPNANDADPSRCGLQPESVHHQHLSKHQAMSGAYHSAGDDCAINELLEGRMELDVLLPQGRKVRLTVERRTPMMDLLVQAASATKISPGGHVIQVFGDDKSPVHYKPSTPIGSLDTKTICIVPKKESGDPLARRTGKNAPNRPFEPTFRVQVHLPRNQLTVLRVSPRIKISELKSMVCKEKGMELGRYQLVRTSGPTQPLDGEMTLAEYGSTEITLLSNTSIESQMCNSSHIIPYAKEREEPKRKNGILRLLTEDARNKANESSKYNSASHVDGIQSDEHQAHQHRYKPKKRRPAPPPPLLPPEAPSHSRQSSSDSSGYHEATSSFLHHSSEELLHSGGEEKASSDSSGVSSLEGGGGKGPSPPPPVVQNNPKKKKAPPPPPPTAAQKPVHRAAPKCPVSKSQSIQQEPNCPLENSSVLRELSGTVNGCSIQQEPTCLLKDSSVQKEPTCLLNDSSSTEKVNGASFEDGSVVTREEVGSKTGEALQDRLVPTDRVPSSGLVEEKSDVATVEDDIVVHVEVSSKTEKENEITPTVSVTAKDSAAKKVDVPLPENGAARKDIRTEACLTELKRVLEDYVSSSDAKDPLVVLQKAAETNNNPSSVHSISAPAKNPPAAKNFTISTYTSSVQKDPIIRDFESASKVNPAGKDHFTRECGHSFATADQILKKDRVPKREDEKKLDLPPSLESRGQALTAATTVAAKALPAASTSTGPILRENVPCEVTSLAETSSSVDANRWSSDKKIRKSSSLSNKDASTTRAALVALHARIERDVSQQEIASGIRAAFHSVDSSSTQQHQQPSLLRIQQRHNSDCSSDCSSTRPTVGSSSSRVLLLHGQDSNSLSQDRTTAGVGSHQSTTTRTSAEAREALLIDEDPPPRPSSAGCSSNNKGLRRSSSLLSLDLPPTQRNGLLPGSSRRQHLQRSLSDLTSSEDGKKEEDDFESEQERLQREYVKLQRQFLLWQRQLMNNHAMLREECLVPQYNTSARTLRQSHSLPEGEDESATTQGVPPLVSRSLSYEPTTRDRCSTLPRSAINITSFDFGSVQLGNGTSTLRSSKTKSYFKPPQVRASTKNRQRLPPEIKREEGEDLDTADDARMLTTILPSFESLRLIAENNDEDTSPFRLTDPICVPTTKKTPVVHLSSTFPKLRSNGDLKQVVNGDSVGRWKQPVVDCPKAEQSAPPPPPPPMPAKSPAIVGEDCDTKSSGHHRNGVCKRDSAPEEDPRERLMLEIRKFGGRTALRKISLAG